MTSVSPAMPELPILRAAEKSLECEEKQGRSMGKPLFAAMDQILGFWPYVVTLLNVLLSLLAAGHAVLSKRDTRAAIGWVGVVWLAPILGVLLKAADALTNAGLDFTLGFHLDLETSFISLDAVGQSPGGQAQSVTVHKNVNRRSLPAGPTVS